MAVKCFEGNDEMADVYSVHAEKGGGGYLALGWGIDVELAELRTRRMREKEGEEEEKEEEAGGGENGVEEAAAKLAGDLDY